MHIEHKINTFQQEHSGNCCTQKSSSREKKIINDICNSLRKITLAINKIPSFELLFLFHLAFEYFQLKKRWLIKYKRKSFAIWSFIK
jgi:hypothetical protein